MRLTLQVPMIKHICRYFSMTPVLSENLASEHNHIDGYQSPGSYNEKLKSSNE